MTDKLFDKDFDEDVCAFVKKVKLERGKRPVLPKNGRKEADPKNAEAMQQALEAGMRELDVIEREFDKFKDAISPLVLGFVVKDSVEDFKAVLRALRKFLKGDASRDSLTSPAAVEQYKEELRQRHMILMALWQKYGNDNTK